MAKFPFMPIDTGDYLADTKGFTTAQHGAYFILLLCAWRSGDSSLDNDDAMLARIVGMTKPQWLKNKLFIMKLWTLGHDNKWRQARLIDEKNYVDGISKKNSLAGQASALKRKNRDSTSVATKPQPESNPDTYTYNLLKEKNTKKEKPEKPEGVTETTWQDFLTLRKAKKAPVTHTVIKQITSEANKIGWQLEQALSAMCARGWQGFNAEWAKELKPEASNGASEQQETTITEKQAEWYRKHAPLSPILANYDRGLTSKP